MLSQDCERKEGGMSVSTTVQRKKKEDAANFQEDKTITSEETRLENSSKSEPFIKTQEK